MAAGGRWVRATAPGFHGGNRKRRGELFRVEADERGRWYVDVELDHTMREEVARAEARAASFSAYRAAQLAKAESINAAAGLPGVDAGDSAELI